MKAILYGILGIGLMMPVFGTQEESNTSVFAGFVSKYKEIHTQDLRRLLIADPSIVLLDTRSIEHDDGKRIPSAKFIPYDTQTALIERAVPNKEALVVVYCTSRLCPDSHFLIKRLLNIGCKNILLYSDGLVDWESCGYPIERAKPGQISGLNYEIN